MKVNWRHSLVLRDEVAYLMLVRPGVDRPAFAYVEVPVPDNRLIDRGLLAFQWCALRAAVNLQRAER